MDQSQPIILNPFNHFEWKEMMEILMRSKGLFRVTMEIEFDPNAASQKIKWHNRRDQAYGLWLDLYLYLHIDYFTIEYIGKENGRINSFWRTGLVPIFIYYILMTFDETREEIYPCGYWILVNNFLHFFACLCFLQKKWYGFWWGENSMFIKTTLICGHTSFPSCFRKE